MTSSSPAEEGSDDLANASSVETSRDDEIQNTSDRILDGDFSNYTISEQIAHLQAGIAIVKARLEKIYGNFDAQGGQPNQHVRTLNLLGFHSNVDQREVDAKPHRY